MAQLVRTLFTDDIDGSEAEGTITFGLGDDCYEIDLNTGHMEEIRAVFGVYVMHARQVASVSPRGRRPGRPAGAGSAAMRRGRTRDVGRIQKSRVIRAWARARGVEINERGRIPADVEAKYEAEIDLLASQGAAQKAASAAVHASTAREDPGAGNGYEKTGRRLSQAAGPNFTS